MAAEHKTDNAAPGQQARMPPVRPRLFVLSGLRLLRDAVVAALTGQPTVQVIGASDLSLPPADLAALAPDVILLEICLPGAIDAAVPLRRAMPGARIVALGVAENEAVVMSCARAGIAGFVHPQGSVPDVVTAIHSAVRGELVCSPRTAGILLNQVSAAAPASSATDEALTPREQEILALVSEGLSNKQIARQLSIGSATVKNHVHSILGKLGVQRRGEAAAQQRRFLGPAMIHPADARAGPDHSARTG